MNPIMLKGLLIIGAGMVVLFGFSLLVALVICNFDPGDEDSDRFADDETRSAPKAGKK